eukprot:6214524-Pleurochrysis_carterae.AAC.1
MGTHPRTPPVEQETGLLAPARQGVECSQTILRTRLLSAAVCPGWLTTLRSLARVAVESACRSALPRNSERSGAVKDEAAASFAGTAPDDKDAAGALPEAWAKPVRKFSLKPTARKSSIFHMSDHDTAGQPPICK